MARNFDCQQCGACCCNPDANRDEGYVDYVAVDAPSPLLRKPDWSKRYVVVNAEGEAHLRLDPSGRCAALVGKLGVRIHCAVYAVRPRGCRLVEPASDACVRARRERGIADT